MEAAPAGWSEKLFSCCPFHIFDENVAEGKSGVSLEPRACGNQQYWIINVFNMQRGSN